MEAQEKRGRKVYWRREMRGRKQDFQGGRKREKKGKDCECCNQKLGLMGIRSGK